MPGGGVASRRAGPGSVPGGGGASRRCGFTSSSLPSSGAASPQAWEASHPREAAFRRVVADAADPANRRLGLAARGVRVRFVASDFNFKFFCI